MIAKWLRRWLLHLLSAITVLRRIPKCNGCLPEAPAGGVMQLLGLASFSCRCVCAQPAVPKQSMASKLTLGTGVSFGRARWGVDGASVFSVADGKALAQVPWHMLCCPSIMPLALWDLGWDLLSQRSMSNSAAVPLPLELFSLRVLCALMLVVC
jgi:hypothetical protein